MKRHCLNSVEGVWQDQRFQISAVIECSLTDSCKACAESDFGELIATVKGIPADACQLIWKVQDGQTLTIIECSIANAFEGFGNDQTGYSIRDGVCSFQ